MIYLFAVLLHLLISALVYLGIRTGILQVHKFMFFVALFLPFWGALAVLVLHFKFLIREDGDLRVGVEKMELESELYRSIPVDESKTAETTVPIEEALVVNTAQERRAIIMDVLNDDPGQYIEFLQKAGNNEDTEVVHYAVTAMVEVAKANDTQLQKFGKRLQKEPENMTLLRQYIDFLWDCLSRGMMQGQVEKLNRELLSSLIRKKVSAAPCVEDFTRGIQNELARGNYTLAAQLLSRMESLYPDTEEACLARLEYLAATGNGKKIKELLADIHRKDIFLSTAAKEVLAFWEA